MQTIWSEQKTESNTELLFALKVGKKVDARLSLVAKDIYNLYINGEFVSYGPARSAKGYCRVDKINIGSFLTRKVNVIEVYVQYNGTRTLCFSDDDPYFGAELISNGEVIAVSEDFDCYLMNDKTIKVERMSSQRGYVEVYRQDKNRYLNSDERLKLKTKRVDCPIILERNVSYSKNERSDARILERNKFSSDGKNIWENDFTKMLDSGKGLYSYKRSECECVLSKELLMFKRDRDGIFDSYLFSFDDVECGKFVIKAELYSDADIWLVYDDILIDGDVLFNREQIIHGLKWSLKAGSYTLYSQEVYSAKYIRLIIGGKADIKSFSVIRIENPANIKEFNCKDEELTAIYDAAVRSFRQNAYDILTDCPSRERSGWLCDSYFIGKAESFFTGCNVVEKNFLENYKYYKNEIFDNDGILPMCYPSVSKDKNDYIPNWILWFVLEVKDYRERTGDDEFVMSLSGKVRAAMDFFANYENEFGLLENLDGWVFVEWSKSNDYVAGVNCPSNILYYAALDAAADLLGDTLLKSKANKLKNVIIDMFYDGKMFYDEAFRDGGKLCRMSYATETCQNYAAYFNIIDNATEPAFYDNFYNRFAEYKLSPSNVFIGYILRLLTLCRDGQYERVEKECKDMFLPMAIKTGTIWELFADNASCNHGFGSVLGMMLYLSQEKTVKEGEK